MPSKKKYDRELSDYRREKNSHLSLARRIEQIRPPSVNLTYYNERGCTGIEERTLPFVLGIIGDFVGTPKDALPPLEDRKFVEIDIDNFIVVMACEMKPHLAYSVKNKLQIDESELDIDLNFKCLEDFEPDHIVQQVEPLRKLVEARQKLSDLRSILKGSKKLKKLLEELISDLKGQKDLHDMLGR